MPGGQVPGGQVPGGQVPGGQVPGRTSYPRTSAREDKLPQDKCHGGQVPPTFRQHQKRSGTCPPGTMLGHVHVLRHIFVLDMFCQQFWGVVRLRGVHLYWIYSANNCGVLFTCWGVCVPFGHRVGSCTTKGTTVISGGQVPGGQVPDLF